MRRRGDEPAGAVRIVVDPVRCEAVGFCAHLAPDLVGLDRWGYPLLESGVLPRSRQRAARRAVRGCPRRALGLVEVGRS